MKDADWNVFFVFYVGLIWLNLITPIRLILEGKMTAKCTNFSWIRQVRQQCGDLPQNGVHLFFHGIYFQEMQVDVLVLSSDTGHQTYTKLKTLNFWGGQNLVL